MRAIIQKTNQKPSQSLQKGFSLIEVMVVLSIIAIIATIATPSMNRSIANQNIKNTASTFRAALEEAKVESVIRRQNVTMTYFAADASGTGVTPNSLVVTDASGDEISRFTLKDSIGITITPVSTTGEFVFEPSKRLSGGAVVFTICSNNTDNESPMQVEASAIANITTKKAGTCS